MLPLAESRMANRRITRATTAAPDTTPATYLITEHRPPSKVPSASTLRSRDGIAGIAGIETDQTGWETGWLKNRPSRSSSWQPLCFKQSINLKAIKGKHILRSHFAPGDIPGRQAKQELFNAGHQISGFSGLGRREPSTDIARGSLIIPARRRFSAGDTSKPVRT